MRKAKTGSASYGIDFGKIGQERWYQWRRFPLVPIIDTVAADEWNPSWFCFSWLNFRFWSLGQFAFALEFHAEDIGIFLRLQLPYLNCYVWLLPFPERWLHKWSRRAAAQDCEEPNQ